MGEYGFGTFVQEQDPIRSAWLLEARDGEGMLLAYIRGALEARLTVSLNAPARLDLTLSLDNPARGLLVGRNAIWLRRKGANDPEHVVEVAEIAERYEDRTVRYVCWDPLWQLAQERVYAYEREAPLQDIVTDWLDRQSNQRPLALGEVDGAVATPVLRYVVEDRETMLHGFRMMAESLEDRTVMRCTWDRRLVWTAADPAVENQVVVGRHALAVDRQVRNDRQVTRLTVYGSNQGGRRVRLSEASGQVEDYLEDPTARWGYRIQVAVDHRQVGIDGQVAGIRDYIVRYDSGANESIAQRAQADGSDVAFYDRWGGRLGHEVLSFDGATGRVEALVGPIDVSAVVDTIFYCFYGGAAGIGQGETGLAPDLGAVGAAWAETWGRNVADPRGFAPSGPVVAQAGILPGIRIREQVVDPETLLAWARQELERVKRPAVAYAVQLLDRAAVEKYTATEYTLGRVQHVVDPQYGLDTYEVVTEIQRDLLNPVDVTISLSRDMLDDDPVLGALESLDQDDRTTWLDADDVHITDEPAEDYPGESPTRLRDWEHPSGGWIDGSKVKGLDVGDVGEGGVGGAIHSHRKGEVVAVLGGGEYRVSLWQASGSGLESPAVEFEAVAVEFEAVSFEEGDLVWVYVPSEAGLAQGHVVVILGGAGAAAAPGGEGLLWDVNSWLNL